MSQAEQWRRIPGYPGYEASTLGRVRSVKASDSLGRPMIGRVLSQHSGRRGYLSVRPSVNGMSQTTSVHKLVALAFLGPRPNGMELAHNDGNTANNRPTNLRYAFHGDNEADKVAHGTKFIAAGERNGKAKLTAEQVASIRDAIAKGESNASLARKHGVDPSLVSHIKRGVQWRHEHGI